MEKILFILTNINNFISHRKNLALALKEKGYEIHIVLPHAPFEKIHALETCGFISHFCEINRKSVKINSLVKNYISLKKIIATVKPDIIFPVSLKAICFVGLLGRFYFKTIHVAGLVTGLGILYTQNNLSSCFLRYMIEKTIQFSSQNKNFHLIFQNPDDQQEFSQKSLIPRIQTHRVNGSGVDLKNITMHPLPEGERCIVFAGRLLREKGILDFLAAAKILQEKGNLAQYIVAGEIDENSRSDLSEADLADYKQLSYIHFIGWQKNLSTLYEKAHIICFPSYYREGIPKVLLEALATGRAIITNNTPGCRETVIPGENGLLITPQHRPQLVDALALLIADPLLQKNMGLRGRALAEEKFSEEQVIADTLNILEKICVA
jgi:glycosyltransferase involved in cell wall biosynthesis